VVRKLEQRWVRQDEVDEKGPFTVLLSKWSESRQSLVGDLVDIASLKCDRVKGRKRTSTTLILGR
jgi:hypothetical protein